MPCEVRILEVEGTQNSEGSLVSLRINGEIFDSEGNSHEKEEIRVEIMCSKYDYIITEVNEDQSWNVVFVESVLKQLVCECFERIQITAYHLPDGTCASGSYDATTPCPCPIIVKIDHEPGACQNGKREIILNAYIRPGNLETIRSTINIFTWNFNDTVVSFIEDETTNSVQSADGFTESDFLAILTSDEEPHEDGLTLSYELAKHTTEKLLFPAPGVSEIELEIIFSIITEDYHCLDNKTYVLKYNGCEDDCKDITEFRVDFGECDERNKKRHVFFSVDQEIIADTYTWKVDGQETTTSTNSADMWLDATGDTEYDITVTSSGPGDCSSEITDTFKVPACRPCKDIKHISVSEGECNKKKNKRKVTITAGQETLADSYTWTVDGQTTTTSSNSVTIWLDAPGTYTVEVKSDGPGSCSSRLKRTFSVSGCNGNGKPSLNITCCGLAWLFTLLFVIGWVMAYEQFQYFWVVLILSGIIQIIWAALCCRKCFKEIWVFIESLRNGDKKPWDAFGGNKGCCLFIRWMILMHEIALFVIAIIGGIEAYFDVVISEILCTFLPQICPFLQTSGFIGPAWVVFALVVGGFFWAGLHEGLKCKGDIPNLLFTHTWPRCKCKKR